VDKGLVMLLGMSMAYVASLLGMGLAYWSWRKRQRGERDQ
jgi:nicotinamide riboside transporter PnuC